MPAFQLITGDLDKPREWFDLSLAEGADPSVAQTNVKDRLIQARDRLSSELPQNSIDQQNALMKLQRIAKEALVEAKEPPSYVEARIADLLAAAIAPAGWTVQYDETFKRIKMVPPFGPPGPREGQITFAADVSRIERQLTSLFAAMESRELSGKFAGVVEGPRKVWRFWFEERSWAPLDRDGYSKLLLEIAKSGLDNQPGRLDYARSALELFRTEIFVLQGFSKRRKYLKICGTYAGAAWVVLLSLYFACVLPQWSGKPVASSIAPIPLALAGSMLGMWISMATGRVATTLEELETVINDPVGAGMRVIYVLAVALAGIALLRSGLVDLSINGLKTSYLASLENHTMTVLLVGVLFGFSEKTLPNVFATRATEFVRSLGSKSS